MEFLPNADHGESVEMAVLEQGVAGGRSVFGSHFGNLRVNGHCIASVMDWALKIIIIQLRIIGEERWQYFLDAEGAVHGRTVHHLLTEWVDEIHNIVANIEQVFRKVGKGFGTLARSSALESLVIGCYAYILRNITAKLLSNLSGVSFSSSL